MTGFISLNEIAQIGAQVKFFHSRTPEEQLYITRQREKNEAARAAANKREMMADYYNPWYAGQPQT
jgi:hypothetical protein